MLLSSGLRDGAEIPSLWRHVELGFRIWTFDEFGKDSIFSRWLFRP
jgi:hypothetical protein